MAPPSEGAQSDGALLCGDADAFAAFYRRHEDSVLRFFLRRTRRAEVAADLAAETFARALSSREAFDPSLGQATAWMFGIARHVLAASVERGQVESEARRRLGMEPLALDDDAIARINELSAEPALSALQTLPADQQLAVTGRVVHERSYPELATQLDCSESVVRQRVSRGLRALRAHLEDR
jgi:RNA polymerase sigma-70 factor (ECF subfamily)